MIKHRAIVAAALLAVGLGLGGCITVFPKAKPVQLYRFGDQTPKIDLGATAGMAPFNLQRAPITFDRAAQLDAILTSSGTETAYLAGARWVAPATILFDEAVDRAFNAAGPPAHLVPRGELGSSGASLRLDVESFEARYLGGKDAPPTVVVQVHALLIRISDRQVLADKVFDVEKPAAENRIGPIISAFDAATTDAIGQIVGWSEVQGEPTATPTPH